MNIQTIAQIIEKSSEEFAKESLSPNWETLHDRRDFAINTVRDLLDRELFVIECRILEIGDEAFGSEVELKEESEEDNSDMTAFYMKLDAIDESLNAIRKLAEIKRYLEVKNAGEFKGVFGTSEQLSNTYKKQEENR